jgi:streptomycin 6-kinase
LLVIDANVLIDYPSGDAGWIAIPTSTLVGSNGWDRYIVLANRNEDAYHASLGLEGPVGVGARARGSSRESDAATELVE